MLITLNGGAGHRQVCANHGILYELFEILHTSTGTPKTLAGALRTSDTSVFSITGSLDVKNRDAYSNITLHIGKDNVFFTRKTRTRCGGDLCG